MSSMRFLFVLSATLAAGAALAQAPAAPPAMASAPPGSACAAERANVAAEETTPGYLRDLMREALAICLAAAQRSAQGSGR